MSDKNKIIDCIVVAESWVNALDEFKLYELKNFNSFMVSRNTSQGGGIIVYIRKWFAANVIARTCNQHIEAILVEVLSLNLRQKILAVYRPPSGNLSVFYEFIDDFLSDNSELLIVGDMNINILNENACNEYRDILEMNDYIVANNFVTRPASGSLLDHVMLKENTDALIFTSKNYKLSDHNFIVLIKKITHQSNWMHTEITKVNFAQIRDELTKTDLMNVINNCPNVDTAFSKLIVLIKSLTDNARVTYKIRHKYENEVPPYVDRKYVRLTNSINNLHDKLRKRRNRNQAVSLLEAKMLNLEEILIKHTEMKAKIYYSNIIANNRSFSWNIINEITGRSKKDENLVIQHNGNVIFDKNEIANVFQIRFNTIINNTSTIIEMDYLGEPLVNSIVMSRVTENDIFELMNDLSLKKAVGSDGLPVKVWKENIDILAPILTILINEMLDSGIYPDILKIAAIKPIHKNGNKMQVENYRGISLLPTINKVFERVIYDKIEQFVTRFKQFDELQFGYRKHYGTQDALCKLYSTISKALDKKKYVVAVFFDISKAFDSIDHKVLLFKLEKMGIRGKALDLIRSYLTNRQQFVKIGDVLSEIAEILFGVPQGSCLGPLLFVLMLYDLKFIETKSSIIKYADDIVLILVCDQLDEIPTAIKKDIDKIRHYYASNGLKLNANKSKYMTFGFTGYKHLDEYMNGNGIEKVESVKYLGVIVDSNLRMNGHTNHLVKKISQSMNAMNTIKKYLPTYSLMQFYNAFIGSHLFCNGFLMCRMNVTDINRLQIIQNKALKTAFGLERRYPTEKLYNEIAVNVLPVKGIAYLNLLLLIKKYILTNSEDFEVINDGRRKNQLKFIRFRNMLADDLVCLGPRVYNQLPLEIREIKSYNSFKRKLKVFLLENKLIFLRGNQLDVNNLFRSA